MAVDYPTNMIWSTLVTKRAYLGGALVLNHSLKKVGSRYQLKIMVTREAQADKEFMAVFAAAGIPTIVIETIEPARQGKVNKAFWQKLAPWAMTEYERIVLLDSDQVILQNIDHLMTLHLPEGHIACSHACTCNPRKLAHYPKDWVPQNCPFTSADQHTGSPAPITPSSPRTHHLLNSGTVVLTPSKPQFDALLDAINTHPDVPHMVFPDQDILAIVYRGKWKPLPYVYNALKPMRDCHASLWRDEDVKILHYILNKPWESRDFDENDKVESTHRLWWGVWEEVEREWTGGEAGEEKRRLYDSVLRSVVAQA
ncbi:glycosyltransferase family 8 protein [Neurospora crassa]|uniref:Glycosyl transferase n=1 Tax=Neurospora crassa (strain ATCC 24698 / 74-OR23-1A / CBS 708.71 / DSM 1257 / FGSC 987) TaxID=367110 RepID=U9W500_NEUCR|nr:glycosyl transferase [Neurospora crassa OR74A]XP_011393798.1 glycosyl transferase, variant [Neurospora crassa OR74A]ESA43318.1 glycosyl transferase [Neurospora crassa OR74A]ESA43319.1 glycosyl transferase, variant [Neurospora crassa OR74A]KHE89667.1 glycosyltransferase family 8 protein [Neurospora crassa]|eukprot:XP_011393797.1 glycosyl transferase [Neurospora crassa OR74A]